MPSLTYIARAAVALLVLGLSHQAAADSETSASDGSARQEAHAIINATAWMPAAGELQVGIGFDQALRPVGDVAFGLGRIAEVGLSLLGERIECSNCSDDRKTRTLAMAYFKIGIPEGMGTPLAPALALLFRKTLPQSVQVFSEPSKPISVQRSPTPSARMSAVASKSIGPLAIHLGADLLTAQRGNDRNDALGTPTLRPSVGLQYIPASNRATTFLADLRWIPSMRRDGTWGTKWSGASGVRYRATQWASVDLNIRLQQGQSAGDALVVLGFRGQFDLASALTQRAARLSWEREPTTEQGED